MEAVSFPGMFGHGHQEAVARAAWACSGITCRSNQPHDKPRFSTAEHHPTGSGPMELAQAWWCHLVSYRDWPWDQRSRSVIPQCNQNSDGTLNSRIPIFWMVTLGCAWINKSPLFINISTYWTQVNESTPERLSIAHTTKLSPWRDALWPYDGRVFSSWISTPCKHRPNNPF